MEVRNYIFLSIFLILQCIHIVYNKRQQRHFHSEINENSDVFLDSEQLLKKYGYPSEKHPVTTEDGYIVNLFRIPNSGPPILLAHGLGDSSDSWLVLGPPNSLAYLLTDAGFDVWLYNARGNKYSKRHTRNLSSKEYWNFSYEELGSQDLPAAIDYILQLTYRPKLSYIGYSQGTTIFIVMCSMKPTYNDKIEHAILLAPVAWTTSLRYPLIDFFSSNLNALTKLSEDLRLFDLFSHNPIVNAYHAKVCNSTSQLKILCELEFYVSYGVKNISAFSEDKLPVVASHIPAGLSVKALFHFMQGYITKKFQRYNYTGPGENNMIYGTPEPPLYNVSSVTAPVTLIASESDIYSTPEDVKILKNKLPNIVNFLKMRRSLDFTHLEFIYGVRAKVLVNDPVVNLLNRVY